MNNVYVTREPNATYQNSRSSVLLKVFLPYIGMAAMLVICLGPFEQTFDSIAPDGSLLGFISIGQVAFEVHTMRSLYRRPKNVFGILY